MRYRKARRTKDPKLQCETEGCERHKEKIKGSNDKVYSMKICATCRSRKNIQRNPATRLYHNLKASAKRRRIYFDITLTEFKFWCIESGFFEMPGGREEGSRSVGRIDHSLGYTLDNIMPEEYMMNSIKQDANEPF